MGQAASTPAVEAVPTALQVQVEISNSFPLEEVIAIAEVAGDAILEIYNGEASSIQIEVKEDKSLLTSADRAANEVICEALSRLTPHIPIISEESKQVAHEIRKEYQYWWCVDPLDGTREFIKRNGQFTVNIALMQGSNPVLGIVHVPCQAKTYWALQGRGAYCRSAEGQKRLQAAEFGLTDPGLVVVGSASHGSPLMQDFLSILTEPKLEQVGSSLKLLMVAEGTAHVYPRLAPTMEWDTAAADVIVREAGGAVLQAGTCTDKGEALEEWRDVLATQQPLAYNKESLLNPFFVVFGKKRQA